MFKCIVYVVHKWLCMHVHGGADACYRARESDTDAARAAGDSSEFTNAARLEEHGKTSRH